MKSRFIPMFLLAPVLLAIGSWQSVYAQAEDSGKLQVLLIDGQNNHGAWKKTTPMIEKTLENTGRFEVTLSRTPPDDGRRPNYGKPQPEVGDMPEDLRKQWADWRPDFAEYDVVVSNYNGVHWPEEVEQQFVDYMKNGGGLVVIHAADNAFAAWPEYNEMIGVGGWYGRSEKDGPAIYWEDGQLVRDDSPGKGGTHGKRAPVLMENVAPDHPIMQGLPEEWLHPVDEVYTKMRGPAKNLTVLGVAYSDKVERKTPLLLTIDYGEGRVFHNMLGHDERGFEGVGFQELLQRGAEWAATGEVTLPPLEDGVLSTEEPAVRDPAETKS